QDLRPPSTFVAEVPSPLSADRPAPVRMTMLWKAATASLDGNRTTIAGCEVGRTPGLTGVSNMKLRNFLLVIVAVSLSLLSTAAMADNCTGAPHGSPWEPVWTIAAAMYCQSCPAGGGAGSVVSCSG